MDVFELLVVVIYLDGGFEVVSEFIVCYMEFEIFCMVDGEMEGNFKLLL